MLPTQNQRKRAANTAFPNRVALYENDEGLELLEELARRRGLSTTAALRALIREAAKAEGIRPREE